MKLTYAEKKEMARNEAIEWQHDFSNHDYSWNEISFFQVHFYNTGKKYGLLKEFRENGII